MDMIIDTGRVVKAYNGMRNRCACGCSGKYFKVEEQPDAVRKIVGKILAADNPIDEGGFVYAEVGNRMYVAYYE